MLGHLGGELFGLVCQSGDAICYFRVYTLAQVQRGDLGPVLEWARDEEKPPTASRASSSRRADVEPEPRHTIPSAPAEGPSTHRRKLGGLELHHVLAHLVPEAPPTGPASTVLPLLRQGLCALVIRGHGDQLLWAKQLRKLLAGSVGVQIHCCAKIFNLALRAIAAETELLVRRGRRWLLRLGELQAQTPSCCAASSTTPRSWKRTCRTTTRLHARRKPP